MSDWWRTGVALALVWLAAGGAEAAEARSALLTSELWS